MAAEDLEKRMAALESRLVRIEALLAKALPQLQAAAPPPVRNEPPRAPEPSAASPAAPEGKQGEQVLVTNILGWGGAVALVLAAVYLIRLAIDIGWLTPARQVTLAALAGLTLIGGGFALRNFNRQYAGLLPAAGVAILFLTTFGAHLYHGIIGAKAAGAAVVAVCLASLWLCRLFTSDLYALFAVAGSYTAPLWLSGLHGSVTDLVIYFSAWGVVFSVFAIWRQRRLIYLLALYLALICFDATWRRLAPDAWGAVLLFQAAQFVIFGVAAALFSVRNAMPMSRNDAYAHLPPLLIFYFLQYTILERQLPALAPWVAVASLAFLAALYGTARMVLRRPLPGGELLLWAYVALVLFHAGYVESVPERWAPWVAFVLMPVLALLGWKRGALGQKWPLSLAIGLIFAVNFLRVVLNSDLAQVPARELLAIAYAVLLYVGYWLSKDRDGMGNVRLLLLYMGHVSAMAAALQLWSERIAQSAVWAVLAIAWLGVSLWQRDRLLGQSSLFVFGVAAGKVMLHDLSGASPVARIIGLVVLGVSFYIGGLLYQRLPVAAPKS